MRAFSKERYSDGRGVGRITHRRGDKYSSICPIDQGGDLPAEDAGSLALPLPYTYNGGSERESFRVQSTERHKRRKSALDPLVNGKPVSLLMEHPPKVRVLKELQLTKATVIIVPGELIGSGKGTFLVSILGKGSALVSPMKDDRIAKLVLAGIPSTLAKALMQELRLISISA